MAISSNDVQRLASLARLNLDADEVEAMRCDLDAILTYVGKLAELDTSAIAPTAHVLDIETPLRVDAVGRQLTASEAVRNAPAHDDSSMIVPKVVE